MPIILRLDRVMADRKMSLNELSERVGVSNVNLSKIKLNISFNDSSPFFYYLV
jgi:DNA-binding Xre family transcriptional regulator